MAIIRIEQSHIDQGTQLSSRLCPVALALREALTTDYVFVGLKACTIYFDFPCDWHRNKFNLPPEATSFIRRFDGNHEVKPMEFEIDLSVGLEKDNDEVK